MFTGSLPVVLVAERHVAEREELRTALDERYAGRFTVLAAGDRAEAGEIMRRLTGDGRALAMVVTGLHLHDGLGVDLLERAAAEHPGVRKVLLASAPDVGAAIEAMNWGQADRYVTRPAEPAASDRLYPVTDNLLSDWEAHYGEHHARLRLLGHRFSRQSYEIKDFLARNLMPFRWLDVDDPAGEGRGLAAALGLPAPCPATVVLDDGTALREPGLTELAEALGLAEPIARDFYDLVVVGGGPAGLASGVYGACEGWRVLVLEDDAPGGQAGSTSKIENYLGFPAGLTGVDLARRALDQAKRLGVEWASTRVATVLRAAGDYRLVTLADGTQIACSAMIIATGMQWRRLPTPGIESLTGKGVYYGACLTEALETTDEDIFMVGAGNSAGQAALHFAEHAGSVTMLIRRPSLREGPMSAYLVDRIEEHPSIHVRPHTEVAGISGEDHLTGLTLRDTTADTTGQVPATSLYVLIGATPCSNWLAGTVALNKDGYIRTAADVKGLPEWPLLRDPLLMETSLPGVFAAGDVRAGSAKRIGPAVGDGAVAVQAVAEYLRNANLKM